jgi:glycosyltransferase involved in cell wall biosynthesis
MSAEAVSVIMPTIASEERAAGLVRAVESVVSQRAVAAIPLVIVNGGAAVPELVAHLRRRRDIRLAVLDEASLPRALRVGRSMVDTAHFAVLDDDDELLPDALAFRLEILADTACDAVVTNGFIEEGGRRQLSASDFHAVEADPLRALLGRQWLLPCAGLFQTSAVPDAIVAQIPAYREWTYLALCLASGAKMRFAARPTFVYRADTPRSLSKSREYCLGGPAAIARMLELDLPSDVRRALLVRLGAEMHSASELELQDGNHGAAWRWHVRSLAQPLGWRYLAYSRHLLAPRRFQTGPGRPG